MTGRLAIVTLGLGVLAVVYVAADRSHWLDGFKNTVYRGSARIDAAFSGIDRGLGYVTIGIENQWQRAARLPGSLMDKAGSFFISLVNDGGVRPYLYLLLVVIGVIVAIRLFRSA
jgi:hypothetical protein